MDTKCECAGMCNGFSAQQESRTALLTMQTLQCGIDCQTVGYPRNKTSCETLYYGLQAGFSGSSLCCLLHGLVYCVYKSSDLPDDVVKLK